MRSDQHLLRIGAGVEPDPRRQVAAGVDPADPVAGAVEARGEGRTAGRRSSGPRRGCRRWRHDGPDPDGGDVSADRRDDMLAVLYGLAGPYVQWIAFRRVGRRWVALRFKDPAAAGFSAPVLYMIRWYVRFRDRAVQLFVRRGLGLRIERGDIVERVRQYRREPERDCCPDGRWQTRRFRLGPEYLEQVAGPRYVELG
jgi:hypothetical protein